MNDIEVKKERAKSLLSKEELTSEEQEELGNTSLYLRQKGQSSDPQERMLANKAISEVGVSLKMFASRLQQSHDSGELGADSSEDES